MQPPRRRPVWLMAGPADAVPLIGGSRREETFAPFVVGSRTGCSPAMRNEDDYRPYDLPRALR